MFFEDGWVPLSDVTSEVFRRLQSLQADGTLANKSNGLTGTLAVSVWDICDACTKIGVTGPDGNVVPASKDLVAWADPHSLSNEHVDLLVGTVGSSTLKGDDGTSPGRDALVLRYGPFLNLPIVIPINNFQSSLSFLADEVTNEAARDEAVINGARTILQMVKEGQMVTRDIARTRLGAGLSRRKFKNAWALAARHHPDLAAPNRWLGL